MCISLLVLVIVLFTHLQELLQLDYGSIQITQLFVDESNPLVTDSLLFTIVGSLGHI